jgi:hypothetical protein
MRKEITSKKLWCCFPYPKSGLQKTFLLFVVVFFSSFGLFAQNKTVSGVVKDENDMPLPGVSVSVKGSSGGVTTADDGTYFIVMPASAEALIFSYVNYVTQEFKVTTSTTINVSMKKKIRQIE